MLPIAIFSRCNTHGGRPTQLANESIVGWTGAYPELCRKRPTASLVSRKVLTPLLGQVLLCITIQLVGFEFVQRQAWLAPRRPGGEYFSLTNAKVHSSPTRYPKVQYQEFREYNSLLVILFSVHIFRDCTQCRLAL